MDWVGAAVKDSRPLPLRSSLAGIERVAKTISIFWEAFFSLRGGGVLGDKWRLSSIRSNWGLGDIRGHSLGCVYFLFNDPRLLGLFGRTVKGEKGLGRAILANICLLKDNVSLGFGRA